MLTLCLRRALRFAVLAGAVFGVTCYNTRAQQEQALAPQTRSGRPTIVFMTDFGTANDAVAICRAVIYGIAPDVRLTDITHQVTPFQIEEAARFLEGVTPYYPARNDFSGGCGPGSGHFAQGHRGEIQEGPILRVAGQWRHNSGDRARRIAKRPRNHQSKLDDRRCDFLYFSRTRYFFAGGRAPRSWLGLQSGWAGSE